MEIALSHDFYISVMQSAEAVKCLTNLSDLSRQLRVVTLAVDLPSTSSLVQAPVNMSFDLALLSDSNATAVAAAVCIANLTRDIIVTLNTIKFLLQTFSSPSQVVPDTCLIPQLLGARVSLTSPCGELLCAANPVDPTTSSSLPGQGSFTLLGMTLGVVIGIGAGVVLCLVGIFILVRRRLQVVKTAAVPGFLDPRAQTEAFLPDTGDIELRQVATERLLQDDEDPFADL